MHVLGLDGLLLRAVRVERDLHGAAPARSQDGQDGELDDLEVRRVAGVDLGRGLRGDGRGWRNKGARVHFLLHF